VTPAVGPYASGNGWSVLFGRDIDVEPDALTAEDRTVLDEAGTPEE
jgi:hypothetical protein